MKAEVQNLYNEMCEAIKLRGYEYKWVSRKITQQSETVLDFRWKSLEIYKEKMKTWEWTPEQAVDFLHSFWKKTTPILFAKKTI